MIIRLKNEKNLVEAVDVKLIKNSDFQDTLTFKVPIDENITVDEKIKVKTKVFNEDYRVKEVISKLDYKDVFCEHVFFDCKNVVIPYIDEEKRSGTSINDFSRYTDLRAITSHLNRIMRSKGDNEFIFTADFNKAGVVECDDTTLYDLIFGEKGILATFKCGIVYHNHNIKFVEKMPSKNTEILFYERKNISELQETVDFKNIVTKLHVTATYRVDNSEEGKAERERLKAQKRRELFEKSQQRIKEREEKQKQQREERRKQQEAEYQANRNRPKRTQAEIHADYLKRQEEYERRVQANNEARRLERERRFNEREQQRVITSKNKEEEFTFRTVFTSPLISEYERPYEAALSISSDEITDEESLKAWCNANLFTEEDTRDVPIKNFSFKPVDEDYNVDINDRAKVIFTSIGVNKIVHCCKIEYDALHDKYLNIEFGELNRNFISNAIGSLNSKISETNSNFTNALNNIDRDFELYVQQEIEAANEQFRIDKEEFEDSVRSGVEEARIAGEQEAGRIATEIDNKIEKERSSMLENVSRLDSGLSEAKRGLNDNKNNLNNAINQLNKAIVDGDARVSNLVNNTNVNLSNLQNALNSSKSNFDKQVNELRQLANTAQQTGKLNTSKLTELENGIQREFTEVKGKIPTSVGARNLVTNSKTLSDKNAGGQEGNTWTKEVIEDGIIKLTCLKDNSIGIWVSLMNFLTSEYQDEQMTWGIDLKANRNITIGQVGQETNGLKYNVKITTNWQRITHTFTNKFTNWSNFVFYYADGGFRKGDILYLKRPKLEKGTIATDWTPAPEDFEKDLEVTKSEFKQTSDGLFSKVEKLEEYKNADGSRTQSLKNWVQQDTADKLARERTEVNKIIDNKGFVKNEQFSNKFEENARGINQQLTELNNYKNADGSRQEALRTYSRDETARQLATERQSVERWINDKGFATIDYANNKVQETANSFSREISNVRSQIPTSVGSRNRALGTTFEWDKFTHFESENGINSGGNFYKVVLDGLQAGDKLHYRAEISIDNVVRFGNMNMTANLQCWGNVTDWDGWARILERPLGGLNEGQNYKGIIEFDATVNPTVLKNNYLIVNVRLDGVKSADVHFKALKIEKGTIATDWTPAPEDATTEINQLNTWKQTASETLNRVSSELNGTLKYSQLQITDNGINFGSGREFNGARLASMINTSPDAVNVITNKMIIANTQNLIKEEYRKQVISVDRDSYVTDRFPISMLSIGDEFVIKGVATWGIDTNLHYDFRFMLHIHKRDGSNIWYIPNNEVIFNKGKPSDFVIPFQKTIKVPDFEDGEWFEFILVQEKGWEQPKLDKIMLTNLVLYKKTNAELIVDGSIEAKHIKSGSIETGHLKAGSVTADIIAADAITADKLLVDDAMIKNFAANKAFIAKLWTQKLWAEKLNTIQFDFTKATGEYISSTDGDMTWYLNENKLTMKNSATIEFTSSSNLLFREYNGQKAFINFVNSTDNVDNSVVVGGNRDNTFNPNNGTFVGMRVFPKSDSVSILADRLNWSGGLDENNGVDWNVLTNEVIINNNNLSFKRTKGALGPHLLEVDGYIKTTGINSLKNSTIFYINAKGEKVYATEINYKEHSDISLIFGQYVYNEKENGIVVKKGITSERDIYYRYGTEYLSLYYNLKAASSDRNLKENIVDTPYNALDFIKKFKFKEHDWIEGKELYRKKHTKIGLIAQEVQEIDDSLVYKNGEYLSLDTLRLANLALKAIQELDAKNKDLEQKIKILEEKINE